MLEKVQTRDMLMLNRISQCLDLGSGCFKNTKSQPLVRANTHFSHGKSNSIYANTHTGNIDPRRIIFTNKDQYFVVKDRS